jgi:hypothetical protein
LLFFDETGVNVFSVAIITKTSAISYQVLGHSKTMGVLAIGMVRNEMTNGSMREGGKMGRGGSDTVFFGVCLGLIGSWWYASEKSKLMKLQLQHKKKIE